MSTRVDTPDQIIANVLNLNDVIETARARIARI